MVHPFFKYVQDMIMMSNNLLEVKLIKLQQRNYDLKWTILTVIELLEKGNTKKALKLLKKVLYEK